jgi:hypothetical protein
LNLLLVALLALELLHLAPRRFVALLGLRAKGRYPLLALAGDV